MGLGGSKQTAYAQSLQKAKDLIKKGTVMMQDGMPFHATPIREMHNSEKDEGCASTSSARAFNTAPDL